jgi:rhodanese-related sulfurtransferase/DNA-binding transcriptional ArsR family regulator
MGSRIAKDRLYGQLARVTKALASPARLEMLDLLAQGERSVESLADEIDLSVANASKHLQILRAAHLVTSRRAGNHVLCRLATPDVERTIIGLRGLASTQLAELDRVVDEYLGSRDDLAPIGRAELIDRARAGDVTVVDVRPKEEFAAGHLPGALSIPVATLAHRLAELPPDREVVAYCRGPWCVYAFEAVEQLRRHGFRARRLEDGLPEWRAAGLPVEAS